MVRQLFELGVLQSGFWHQFALTAHSPIGMNPSEYGITPNYKNIEFANNDVAFKDHTGINHSKFSFGLKKSLFNYMHGIAFDFPLEEWFDFKIPKTTIHSDFIYNCLEQETNLNTKPTAKIIWLGNPPLVTEKSKTKKGVTYHQLQMMFHNRREEFSITTDRNKGLWLVDTLEKMTPFNDKQLSFTAIKTDFETHFEDFELFWFSKPVLSLRDKGLLVL